MKSPWIELEEEEFGSLKLFHVFRYDRPNKRYKLRKRMLDTFDEEDEALACIARFKELLEGPPVALPV